VLRLEDGFTEPPWLRTSRRTPVLEDLLIVLEEIGRGIGGCAPSSTRTNASSEALNEQLVELNGLQNRIELTAAALRTAFMPGARARPAGALARAPRRERRRGPARPQHRVNAAPIELAGLLREALFDRVHSTVLTSATLTSATASASCAAGSASTAACASVESVHPSPFDFATQTILAVPSDDAPDGRERTAPLRRRVPP
jgi:Rad3-related DNA helicase